MNSEKLIDTDVDMIPVAPDENPNNNLETYSDSKDDKNITKEKVEEKEKVKSVRSNEGQIPLP